MGHEVLAYRTEFYYPTVSSICNRLTTPSDPDIKWDTEKYFHHHLSMQYLVVNRERPQQTYRLTNGFKMARVENLRGVGVA